MHLIFPSKRWLPIPGLLLISLAFLEAAPPPQHPNPLHPTPANRSDYFVRTSGQTASGVLWQASGDGFRASFARDRFVLTARTKSGVESQSISFLNMDRGAVLEALDPLPGKASFFIGNDPSRWARGLSTYSRLKYRNLYPGIDLVFYWNAGHLEYDFAVAPGADPQQIRLQIEGDPSPRVTESGDLRTGTGALEVLHRPLLYQNTQNGRKVVNGKFAALPERAIGFELADYDRTRELIIDPTLTLLYSTYLGGGYDDEATAIALDSSGNSYILGYSASLDYPASANAYQPELKDTVTEAINGGVNPNVVVTKISPNGTLLFSTYLGGSNADHSAGLALDAQGNAYFSGTTDSPDFPLTANAYQSSLPANATESVFLAELSPDGSSLIYSSLFTGSGNSTAPGLDTTSSPQGTGVVLDSHGRIYLAGNAGPGLPTTAGAYLTALPTTYNGNPASFVAIFDLTQSGANSLVAATYYGSLSPSRGQVQGNDLNTLILDANNNPWIAGESADTNLPTTANALQRTVSFPLSYFGYCEASFMTQLSSDLSTLQYSTYWAGPLTTSNESCSGRSSGNRLAMDQSGNIFLFGSTEGTGFPTTAGVIEPSYVSGSGETVGFLTKFSPDGTKVIWSTYSSAGGAFAGGIGVSGALVIDAQGNPWIGGGTTYGVTTTSDAYQAASPTGNGGSITSGYISQISSDGTQFLYSTYLAGQNYGTLNIGSRNSIVSGLAFDRLQNLYITGSTASTLFPLSASPYQAQFANGDPGYNGNDIFFTILAQNSVITSIGPTVAGNTGDTTITITGAGFSQSAGCSLVEGGTTITATSVVVAADGSSIQCTFALSGQTASAYDLSITTPGQPTITQPAAVTLQNGGQTNVAANMIGRSLIRTGVPSTFYVSISNTGTNDAYYVQWAITLSPNLTFTFPSGPLQVSQPNVSSDINSNYFNEADGTTVIPFISFFIPAGSSLAIPIQITSTVGQTFTTSAGIQAVWYDSYAAAVSDFAAVAANPPTASTDCTSNPLKPYLLDCLSNQAFTVASAVATMTPQVNSGTQPLTPTPATIAQYMPITIQALAGQLPSASGDSVAAFPGSLRPMQNSGTNNPLAPLAPLQDNAVELGLGSILTEMYNTLKQQGQKCTVLNTFYKCSNCAGGGMVCLYTTNYVEANCLPTLTVGFQPCTPPTPAPKPAPTSPASCNTQTPPAKIAPRNLSSQLRTSPRPSCGVAHASIDPNYKSGPAGYGTPQYTAGTTPLTYSVGFENDPTASLPAANVYLTDQLNRVNFDLTTLTLQSIVIGANVINIPANAGNYTTTYPISTSLSVRIQGSLNPDTGLLKFSFISIDPTTNLPPTDPTVGFLPPDTDGVSGQGSVIFSIKPLAGQTTGTVVSNQASVVFDANAPIATGVWTNTLDFDAPVSQVTALPSVEASPSFLVFWSGTDIGSGIVSYNIYVSDNGAPFAIWQSATAVTSATYSGQIGHTYGFFSIATDGAGNMQAAKSVADTTTAVASPPALSISKTHTGNFMPGQQNATYTVTVSNGSRGGATAGMVTVTESVPQGMTLVSMADNGTDWNCSGNTCTRSDSLSTGKSYPPITVTVNVASGLSGSLTNQVSVAGGGASATAYANDMTTISPYSSCDVGQYGSTTVADVQQVIDESLGSQSAANDLNNDGVVNVVDIQIVINSVLGLGCTG